MAVETLSPYTFGSTDFGPARIKTATTRFAQRLRGWLGRLNATMREAIVSEDLFGLRSETLIDEPEPGFQFTTTAKKREFMRWLRKQLRNGFLTIISPNENQYIRRAYTTGLRATTRQLRDEVDFETVDLDELVEQDRFDTALQTLFERTYENLRDITMDMADAIRGELATALAFGENPTKVARRLTDRVDKIGKHRATLLARTEMINAHTEGALDRAEQAQEQLDIPMGVRHVGRVTAADADVCPFCRRTSDSIFTIDEFRNTVVEWRGQVWRVAPPSHPNGRCAVQVELGVDDLPPLRDRVPGDILR